MPLSSWEERICDAAESEEHNGGGPDNLSCEDLGVKVVGNVVVCASHLFTSSGMPGFVFGSRSVLWRLADGESLLGQKRYHNQGTSEPLGVSEQQAGECLFALQKC